ncbi:olfactory receptor 11L1-like [Pelodytes ibericus]
MGNATIIAITRAQRSLHTPMYFFISVFASLEIMFVSVTVPKLLSNLISSNKKISYRDCLTQLYAFGSLAETECFLLVVMVYDRHLAIHNPLRYPAIMNHSLCTELLSLPWVLGFVLSSIPVFFTARLNFCGPNQIDHFFCDLVALQNLACSDLFLSYVTTSLATVLATLVPFIMIMGFYINIIISVLNIEGTESKKKAFHTCSSHLIVVTLFYGTAITVYINPKGRQYDKFLALMFTVVTPLLNPFIYTLRNREVQVAMKKTFKKCLKAP